MTADSAATRLTVLIALGTHAPMGEEALAAHLGYAPGRLAETYPGTVVVNHEWWRPEALPLVEPRAFGYDIDPIRMEDPR